MPDKVRIIRKRPGFVSPLNGIAFEPLGEHSISEPMSEDMAAIFLAVPGYELDDAGSKAKAKAEADAKAAAEAATKAKAEAEAAAAAEAAAEAEAKAKADAEAAEKDAAKSASKPKPKTKAGEKGDGPAADETVF